MIQGLKQQRKEIKLRGKKYTSIFKYIHSAIVIWPIPALKKNQDNEHYISREENKIKYFILVSHATLYFSTSL